MGVIWPSFEQAVLTNKVAVQVFDMFDDLPMEGGPCHLPSPPPPGWKERFQARSRIPGILVTYAKLSQEVTALPNLDPADQHWKFGLVGRQVTQQ